MYRLFRNILFLLPPEWTHYFSMNSLKFLCSIGFKNTLEKNYKKRSLTGKETKVAGLSFINPVALAAGFDKNARWLRELDSLGFGAVEIGTVTPLPQKGNDKPRLFRLPADKALINRMGFNNDGVEKITERLRRWRIKHPSTNAGSPGPAQLVIGGNIGKNKQTPNEDAWKDYGKCYSALYPFVDYFVVNVSSPNTPGLRELQEKPALRKILTQLQSLEPGLRKENRHKPLFLKISPDLTREQLDDVIDLAREINLDGIVAANTSIGREKLSATNARLDHIGAGGLSGLPLREKSTEIVRYICEKTGGSIPVIASGGIFTAVDAIEKLSAGASMVQVWTGFIYEGPAIVRRICKGINQFLQQE